MLISPENNVICSIITIKNFQKFSHMMLTPNFFFVRINCINEMNEIFTTLLEDCRKREIWSSKIVFVLFFLSKASTKPYFSIEHLYICIKVFAPLNRSL